MGAGEERGAVEHQILPCECSVEAEALLINKQTKKNPARCRFVPPASQTRSDKIIWKDVSNWKYPPV